ncbi:hypothetical protein AF41_03123 [Citrobacter sp. MGH 55]|nr:hypothetical protein AF41_03123 [Citrobacter sp. MGH 55]
MSMLEREMRHLAKQAGGAHKTVSDRMAQAKRFCERLVGELNVQIRYVRHLKARHIEDYIRHRLAQGIDKRTLQNEMSAIRVILRQAGREKLADGDRISNRAVGIGGASRSGARRAIADGKIPDGAGKCPAERSGAGGSAGAGAADGPALAGGGALPAVV